MAICVEIEIDDAGGLTVGVCPPGEESGEDKSYMKPVESMDVALAKARHFLSGKGDKPATMKEAMFGPEKGDEDGKE